MEEEEEAAGLLPTGLPTEDMAPAQPPTALPTADQLPPGPPTGRVGLLRHHRFSVSVPHLTHLKKFPHGGSRVKSIARVSRH